MFGANDTLPSSQCVACMVTAATERGGTWHVAMHTNLDTQIVLQCTSRDLEGAGADADEQVRPF